MTTERELDAILRQDFLTFAIKVFQTLNPSVKFEPNWHLEAIAYQLDRVRAGAEKQLIINVPPRSLKSILTSVALPAFMMGHDPGIGIICVSHSQLLASKLGRDFGSILESPWYRRTFPGTVVTKDAEGMLETTKGGARLSTSIGASVTGLGGQLIIVDDPMKPDEAPSEAAREHCIRHYRETLVSRLDSKLDDRIVVVMQRLHEDDLCGHLLRDGDWTALVLPAIATTDQTFDLGHGRVHVRRAGDLLHPVREPQSVLDKLRRNLGSAAFEAQYQQSPIPQSGNMVKKDWLQAYQPPPPRDNALITQSWDTAQKGNPANDYSVCTTWLQRNGQHYLIDVFRQKLDFPELIKAVRAQHGKHSPSALLVEDQGSGTSLIQQLRSQYGIHAIGLRSQCDKETRLSTVLPMFEAGAVFLPKDEPWLPALLHELFGFPGTRHDDQVDSITQYLTWAQTRPKKPVFEAHFDYGGGIPSAEDIAYLMMSGRRWM